MRYFMKIFLVVVLHIFLLAGLSYAEKVTFVKEYTYQASELDSKSSCRTISLEMVKRMLLEELGTYLISETEVKDFKLTKDQVKTYSAGIVGAEIINKGDSLSTPGRNLDGIGHGQFAIIEKSRDNLRIKSGKSDIKLERLCFDTIEDAFNNNHDLWLRVASSHDNEPFENSVDKLIRAATGSNLARGNYICSILEKCGLVCYAMRGNRKGIRLP